MATLQYSYSGQGDGYPKLDIEVWANSKADATYLVGIKSSISGRDIGCITVNRATGYVAGIEVYPLWRRRGFGLILLRIAERMSFKELYIADRHMNTKEGNGLWRKWSEWKSRHFED